MMEPTPGHWKVRVVAVPDDGVIGPFVGVAPPMAMLTEPFVPVAARAMPEADDATTLLRASAAVVPDAAGLMVTAAVATTPSVTRFELSPNRTQLIAEPDALQESVLPAAVAAAEGVNAMELIPGPKVSRHWSPAG